MRQFALNRDSGLIRCPASNRRMNRTASGKEANLKERHSSSVKWLCETIPDKKKETGKSIGFVNKIDPGVITFGERLEGKLVELVVDKNKAGLANTYPAWIVKVTDIGYIIRLDIKGEESELEVTKERIIF